MRSVPFVRWINADSTQTSFCAECFKEVGTTSSEIILEAAEHDHYSNCSELSDPVMRGYTTLTDRVLTFLEVHSV
jgi:hypothetical protein